MGNKGTIVTKTLKKMLCDSEHIDNKIILKSATYVDIKSDGILFFQILDSEIINRFFKLINQPYDSGFHVENCSSGSFSFIGSK